MNNTRNFLLVVLIIIVAGFAFIYFKRNQVPVVSSDSQDIINKLNELENENQVLQNEISTLQGEINALRTPVYYRSPYIIVRSSDHHH